MPRTVIQDMNASLSFNGTSTICRVGSALGASLTAPYSVEFWFNANSQAEFNTFFSNGNSGASQFFRIRVGTGLNNIGVQIQNDASGTPLVKMSTTRPLDGNWHHLVWTDNLGDAALYIDSVLDATNWDYTPSGTLTLNQTAVGATHRSTDSNFLRGLMRDVNTYNTALTAAQVLACFNNSRPTSTLDWTLNEGAGTVAYDSSGNGNNGTITSGTYVIDTPTKKRLEVGGNLVYNGDFEYAPPSATNVATTTGSAWLDGTPSGSTTNDLFGWYTFAVTGGATKSAKILNTGKLVVETTATNGSIEMSFANASTADAMQRYAIPILPNTSYSYSFKMATAYTSGDSNDGALVYFKERNGAGSTVFTNTSTKVKTTTDETTYTGSFTTNASSRFLTIGPSVIGNTGTATLIMSATFDDIELRPTTPVTRTAIQDMNSSLLIPNTSGAGVSVAGIIPGTTAFGISLFHRPNGVNSGRIVDFLTGNSGIRLSYSTTSKALTVLVGDGASATSTASANNVLPISTFSNILINYASSVTTVYVNGALVITHNKAYAVPAAVNFTVARACDAVGSQADGLYSNLIYRDGTAFGVNERLALTNLSSNPTSSAYLRFNEGAGTVAYDSSGNGNNGTITSGTYVIDTPTKKRLEVGGNLVYNGDFEYAPVVNVATTTSDRWIDGTAGGSTTNTLFGWGFAAIAGAGSSVFDTTTKFSGNESLKLSSTTTGTLVAARYNSLTGSPITTSGLATLAIPNTSYTCTFMMKTNVVSGSSNGAYLTVQQKTLAGATTIEAKSTEINTTTDWTRYTVTLTTTAATGQYITVGLVIQGNSGAATLIMDAWFDDIRLTPTTNTVRTAVT